MGFTSADYWLIALMSMLVIASLAMYFIKNLIHAVIVFGAFSLIMVVVWLLLNTPDLAITEAASGICTTVMMMVVIYRTSRREE
jgi:energy-converting hydrogenase B subunit D